MSFTQDGRATVGGVRRVFRQMGNGGGNRLEGEADWGAIYLKKSAKKINLLKYRPDNIVSQG